MESLNRDAELLQRFRAGDRDAFTALYRAHQASVFRFALAMTGDESRAAEVTQDVFIWLIHHAGNFDPSRGNLGAFLSGVARKFLRRRRAEEMRWAPLDELSLAEPRTSPADCDAETLRRAIVALPEKYREVVVRCDLEEKSYEEAAGAIGIAVGTVRSRLHRARALLARKLDRRRKEEECPA
jgi:RNA polymerase sigma-70 factor (ECF subfamily)